MINGHGGSVGRVSASWSIPGQVISKTLKMVPAALWLGTQN